MFESKSRPSEVAVRWVRVCGLREAGGESDQSDDATKLEEARGALSRPRRKRLMFSYLSFSQVYAISSTQVSTHSSFSGIQKLS